APPHSITPSPSSPAAGTYGLAADTKPTPPPFTPPSPMPPSPAGMPATSVPTTESPPLSFAKTEAAARTSPASDHPFCSVSLHPFVIDWIPALCFVLILFLTLFPWVRYAPGGYTLYSQNAWQAAFNGGSEDIDGLDIDAKRDASDTP